MSGNNNFIGGNTPAARNIVSGNLTDGIGGQSGTTNMIQGNFIGVDATGTNALGNGGAGIVFLSDGNLIGGPTQLFATSYRAMATVVPDSRATSAM